MLRVERGRAANDRRAQGGELAPLGVLSLVAWIDQPAHTRVSECPPFHVAPHRAHEALVGALKQRLSAFSGKATLGHRERHELFVEAARARPTRGLFLAARSHFGLSRGSLTDHGRTRSVTALHSTIMESIAPDRVPSRTADGTEERAGASMFARPFLALGLESSRPLSGSARFGLDGVDEVLLGRGATRSAIRRVVEGGSRLEILIPAPALSSRHARILRTEEGWRVEDLDSRNGTFVRGERVRTAALSDGDWIEVGGAFFVFRPRWPTPLRALDDVDALQLESAPRALRTVIPELEHQYEALRRIAQSKLSVLLLGETGTGKELLARAVHEVSGRRGTFVAVNCGALPSALVEGLLFGHRRGAFSGAVRDEPGFVRAADGGTLFLDEIGDLPMLSQAALLRVLQENEVVPVGETRPISVDIRVVAATHRPIHALSESDAFRGDLLARLSGFAFDAPPLRTRKEDLGLLVADLITRLAPNRARDLVIGVGAARALFEHRWPSNIRELEQALAASLQLIDEHVIERRHLPKSVGAAPPVQGAPVRGGRIGRSELSRLLEEHAGNVAAVARALGKAPVQVRRWMKDSGVDPEDFRKKDV